MKKIRVQDAIGQTLCHDMARIVIGEVKDTPFRRGQVIREEDIPLLLSMGKEHILVMEESDKDKVHEEDVAEALWHICEHESLTRGEVREGKIEVFAKECGLLTIDLEQLRAINSVGDITIVTKYANQVVTEGTKVAAMRCIPLLLPKEELAEAQNIHADLGRPLIEVKPFVRQKIGVVTTGSEVFEGRIDDAFTPIIRDRVEPMGGQIVAHEIVPDDIDQIEAAIRKVREADADMIFCTGGMSVDADDVTPVAMMNIAKEVVTYGLPVLPGSMVCLTYLADGTPMMGVPGGILFSRPTAFDVMVPRLMADEIVTKADCIELAHGGLYK